MAKYDAIVIGVSAGGLTALGTVLPMLEKNLAIPVIIVQHLSPKSDDFIPMHLNTLSDIQVIEAEDKMELQGGIVYVAPPDYHLLVEIDRSLALSMEERVNYSRPSIDVLFESAAEVFLTRLIGIVLTGANTDGAKGLECIKKRGGIAIVQEPETAEVDTMPRAALRRVNADFIVSLEELGPLLNSLATGN